MRSSRSARSPAPPRRRRDRGRVETTIAGGTGKLNEGLAGAGFSIYEYERTGAHQQNYDLVGGVKATSRRA